MLDGLDGEYGVIHPQILMSFGDDFNEGAFGFVEEGVVFDQIEESAFFAGALGYGVEGDDAGFGFVVDALPWAEVFPGGCDAADDACGAVGEDKERVVVEELGDGCFVGL